MKKLVTRLAVVLFLSFGSAQAALIDTITGFSSSDTYSATSFTSYAITNLNGVENVVGTGIGNLASFTHDYEFTAVSEDLVNISTTTENTLLGFISSFKMSIFNVTDGGMISIGSNSILLNDPTNSTSGAFGSIAFNMMMDNDYLIRLTGDPGDSPNYTLQVSAVPIPAAIWLFGTALIGFVGMSRKTTVS